MLERWSRWRAFPDPRELGLLSAPFGPGVYELRNGKTGELVLFGRSKNVTDRMSSLLPKLLGPIGRSNEEKKVYVLTNLVAIEYRTKACRTENQAKNAERAMLAKKHLYIFPT